MFDGANPKSSPWEGSSAAGGPRRVAMVLVSPIVNPDPRKALPRGALITCFDRHGGQRRRSTRHRGNDQPPLTMWCEDRQGCELRRTWACLWMGCFGGNHPDGHETTVGSSQGMEMCYAQII
jgi:hypothetical protein